MRIGVVISAIWVGFMAAACQPAAPTVVYVVVTDTPAAEVATEPPARAALSFTATPTPTAAPPTATPNPTATLTPDPVPTSTFTQVQVAEQVFENGRMFWLQPYSEIWVLVLTGEGQGEWQRYEDSFDEENDPEDSDELEPPEGYYEPKRGFGKLWRETPDLRETLGWGITPEFGYISDYHYHPRGDVIDGEFVESTVEHQVLSLNGEAFCLNEQTGRWRLGC